MSGEQFSLVWNSFPTNLSSGLYTLLTDEHLVDVTLTAEGRILRAHKLILSVCSSYFRELFEGNACKHPIVILKDVNYRDLSAMLHFMYQGEVNIKQEDISSFLKLAETLQIKGLTKEKQSDCAQSAVNEEEKDDFSKTDLSCRDPLGINADEKTVSRRTEEPIRSSDQRISPSIRIDGSFVKVKSDNAFQQSETDSDTENAMRSTSGIFNENYDNRSDELSMMENEPLDCTSDLRLTSNNEEPLNYRLNANTMNDRSSQDLVPNLQLLSYSQDCKKETLGVENAHQPKDSKGLHYDGTSYSRGKRTVRGLQGGTLPLEATLRVVSEIGPTLRVDRGKIVRMYSCPWCLRHFTRKENLKLHVRYIHGPLESLTCKLCGNKYKNSNSLRVHSYLYHNTRRGKHAKTQLLGGNVS